MHSVQIDILGRERCSGISLMKSPYDLLLCCIYFLIKQWRKKSAEILRLSKSLVTILLPILWNIIIFFTSFLVRKCRSQINSPCRMLTFFAILLFIYHPRRCSSSVGLLSYNFISVYNFKPITDFIVVSNFEKIIS